MAIRYLLDTNICIYIAKHNPPAVRARFEQLSSDALAMSVVTLGELQHGAEKSQARDKALAVLQQLQGAIQVMPLAPAAGAHYGHARRLPRGREPQTGCGASADDPAGAAAL